MKKQFVLIITSIFLLLSALFYGLKIYAPDYRFAVLMIGNIIIASLSIGSFLIVTKSINERPAAFVRGVYGATLMKLMVCLSSVLVYALLNKHNIHKPSLFMLFGMYVVYTSAETLLLSKLARQAK